MPEAQPTDGDHANANRRQEIAERLAEEYGKVKAWALGAFGPGWEPSGRHFLIDHTEEDRVRYTAERPTSAATVYTVKNAAGDRRHFTIEDGKVKECSGYEQGFGDMLKEAHPTHVIVVRGEEVHPPRFSLCWAPFELYRPKTAEQLASLRVSRETKKAARELKRWLEENPLLAAAGILPEDLE